MAKAKKKQSPEKWDKDLRDAQSNPEIKKIYANGFVNGLGIGDVVILLQHADNPVAVLNLSYTVAKTLSIKLGSLISSLEDATGNKIMTTDDITESLYKGDVE